ncbi:hypothetical protein MHU86_12296 [Fragilaria crotonensis]|nr:hypothetical protein MHU86_12296 [Fragilaria crotonensis]
MPKQRSIGDRSSATSAALNNHCEADEDFVIATKIDDDFDVSFSDRMSNNQGNPLQEAPSPTQSIKSDVGSVCMVNPEDGHWICHPYKRQKLQDEIDQAQNTGMSKKGATLETLQRNNVSCYIVTHESSNILKAIRSIIDKAASENVSTALLEPNVKLRCCLFEDENGRLFNLVVSEHSVGPATEWASLLQSFSGIQAMIAFVVLCRSFPCAFANNIGQLQPALLSVIMGLVFKEEISLSAVNVSMLVRCMPSVSAHTLTSELGSDWLRKIATLLLAFAGAATGDGQKYMTITGIFIMAGLLLANLGSRAWHFMKWKPISYRGPFSPAVGYVIAMLSGFVLPFMGYREIEAGGKPALESVIGSALIVAIVFVLSDIDEIQSFIVVGSEACPQNDVNVVVSIWWTLTFVSSLAMVLYIKPHRELPANEEHLLVPAQESPVGFRVPNLPDYVVDPILAKEGISWISKRVEFVFGVVVALVAGGLIIYLNSTNVDNILTGEAR